MSSSVPENLQKIQREQREICNRFRVPWVPAHPGHTIIISNGVPAGEGPIHGMRDQPLKPDDTGWVLISWGTPRNDDGTPRTDSLTWAHAGHLYETRPVVARYLGLPPGWRFIVEDQGEFHEDVWKDES